MDVNVDGYAGFLERQGHNDVGGLPPDSLQRKQLLERVGHATFELVD